MRRIVAVIVEAFAAKSPMGLALFGSASQFVARDGPALFVAAGAASVILVNGMLVRVERPADLVRRPPVEAKAMMALVGGGGMTAAPARGETSLMAWLGLKQPFAGMPFEAPPAGPAANATAAARYAGGAQGESFTARLGQGFGPFLTQDLVDLLGDPEESLVSSQFLAELDDTGRDQLALLDPGLLPGSGVTSPSEPVIPDQPVAPLIPDTSTPVLPIPAPQPTPDPTPEPPLDPEPLPLPPPPLPPAPPPQVIPPVPDAPPLPGPGIPAPPIVPVPEPGVWLQLIAGVGAVAFVLRRRNRRMQAAPNLR